MIPLIGKNHQLTVQSNDKIIEIKKKIDYKTNFPSNSKIELVFDGKVLEDDKQISDYPIKN